MSASPARPAELVNANTYTVFGDQIDLYDIAQSVEDGRQLCDGDAIPGGVRDDALLQGRPPPCIVLVVGRSGRAHGIAAGMPAPSRRLR